MIQNPNNHPLLPFPESSKSQHIRLFFDMISFVMNEIECRQIVPVIDTCEWASTSVQKWIVGQVEVIRTYRGSKVVCDSVIVRNMDPDDNIPILWWCNKRNDVHCLFSPRVKDHVDFVRLNIG